MSSALKTVGWRKQSEEWSAIGEELAAARPGGPVTAYQVSLEQKKRMLARGERPMSYEEILQEYYDNPKYFHQGEACAPVT